MNDTIRTALSHSQVIDITTTGRLTRLPRRIEIMVHVFGGRLFISGMPTPRTRAWIRNLEADPNLTVHLKASGVSADLPATARIVTDEGERRDILRDVAQAWRRTDLDQMVSFSPLIEVTIPGLTNAAAA